MKKRSAMAIAAGLVAALLAGAVALSFGLSGSQTADAGSGSVTPRVRTVHRTVTVHRQAKAEEPRTVTVVTASASSPSSSESSGDDAFEDEGSDDPFEDEGYEDEEDSEDSEESEDSEDSEDGFEESGEDD